MNGVEEKSNGKKTDPTPVEKEQSKEKIDLSSAEGESKEEESNSSTGMKNEESNVSPLPYFSAASAPEFRCTLRIQKKSQLL